MSDITVREVSLLRKALERDIQERIASFKDSTGVAVTHVHVSRVIAPAKGTVFYRSAIAGIEISTTL